MICLCCLWVECVFAFTVRMFVINRWGQHFNVFFLIIFYDYGKNKKKKHCVKKCEFYAFIELLGVIFEDCFGV